ncbi:MAG TPA: hypothetical protein VFX55_19675 [Duganella sp.]|nr:hypothetical protein [Duganella sp.]
MTDTESSAEHELWKGFVGTSAAELELMSDEQLAVWQSGWKEATANYILADREWQRRQAYRALAEQFKLEDRLARVNRWWGIGAAAIGVIGTLVGAWFGAQWQASVAAQSAPKPMAAQPIAPADAAKSPRR